MRNPPLNIAVLISGQGSLLPSLIQQAAKHNYNIQAVISSHAGARGLDLAKSANLPVRALDKKNCNESKEFEKKLLKCLSEFNIDLIVMAGFMHIVSAWFIATTSCPILNIHPSLLPKYPGLNTHQRVLNAGEDEHGCSVHVVNHELDGGPLIAQAALSIHATDTAQNLKARVLKLEALLYPQVLGWLVQGRLNLKTHTLDGCPIAQTGPPVLRKNHESKQKTGE